MRPAMLLQIPLGRQHFVANGAFVCFALLFVLLHMHLQTRFDIFLVALWTFDRIVFGGVEAIGVR